MFMPPAYLATVLAPSDPARHRGPAWRGGMHRMPLRRVTLALRLRGTRRRRGLRSLGLRLRMLVTRLPAVSRRLMLLGRRVGDARGHRLHRDAVADQALDG